MFHLESTLILVGAVVAISVWFHVLLPVKASNPFGM